MVGDGIQDAHSERNTLRQIERQGFPTARILDIGTVEIDCVTFAAHTMKRYACSDRDINNQLLASILCDRTLKQAEEMLQLYRKLQPFHIEDLQFLFEWDGSFVIADPIWTSFDSFGEADEGEFQRLIRGCHFAEALRAGGASFTHRYFFDSADDWCRLGRAVSPL